MRKRDKILRDNVNRYYRNIIRKINRYWPDPDRPPREEITVEEMGLCMSRMLHDSVSGDADKEALKKVWDKVTRVLSAEDVEIISMRTSGQSFRNIAEHLGTYKVKVFRRYTKILEKLRLNLNDY